MKDLLTQYYNKACERYTEDRVIVTYFNDDSRQVTNVIIPTIEMLFSFQFRVLSQDFILGEKYVAKDTDCRYFSIQEIIEIKNTKECVFNEEYAAAIAKNDFFPTVLRAANKDSTIKINDAPNRIREFENDITKKEKEVLSFILKEIGLDGIISISNMLLSIKVSRPVVTSLINKLKEFNIAEVTNLGVKGTRIKILNKKVFDLV